MAKKYQDIVLKMRRAYRFKPMPRPITYYNKDENIDQMRKNLWKMFDVPYNAGELKLMWERKQEPLGSSVTHYVWSTTAMKQFYDHPYHRKLVKFMKAQRGMLWGMWCLQCEPVEMEDEEVKALIKLKRRKR